MSGVQIALEDGGPLAIDPPLRVSFDEEMGEAQIVEPEQSRDADAAGTGLQNIKCVPVPSSDVRLHSLVIAVVGNPSTRRCFCCFCVTGIPPYHRLAAAPPPLVALWCVLLAAQLVDSSRKLSTVGDLSTGGRFAARPQASASIR